MVRTWIHSFIFLEGDEFNVVHHETEGVVEIWLTSEDTGAYGKDIGVTIVELLWKIVPHIPEGCMLRIGMTNPPYILEHIEVIYLTLQSASSRCWDYDQFRGFWRRWPRSWNIPEFTHFYIFRFNRHLMQSSPTWSVNIRVMTSEPSSTISEKSNRSIDIRLL